ASCPAPPKIAGDEIKNVDRTHAHRLALLLLVSGLDWYCISATHILASLISFFSPHISLPFSLHKHTHASCPYFAPPRRTHIIYIGFGYAHTYLLVYLLARWLLGRCTGLWGIL
ncbi:hypothetical protein FB451DRAFT_1289011, partial [Mycena latifolia]